MMSCTIINVYTTPDYLRKRFNRINAHLANERTYLAWARTVMSILSVSFTLNTEANKSFDERWYVDWHAFP